jgi:tetratricopeptide (TPR) repeat protein
MLRKKSVMKVNSYKILSICILLMSFFSCAPEYYKLNQSGYLKIKNSNYAGAFSDFDSSIKLNDKYWLAYLNRGASHAQVGNCISAIQDFDRSINLHSKNALAFDNRGLCKVELNDKSGAIADFKQALKLNNRLNIVYTHLGILLSNMDSCEQAVYYLEIAIEKKAFNDCYTEQQVVQMKSRCKGSLLNH